jgi:putative ABC transport system permease protein
MLRIALKSVLARKSRLALTAIAVVLGTSFLSGTYVFSDTLKTTFNQLFADVFQNTNSFVRSSNVIEGEFGREQRQLVPVSLVQEVKNVDGVLDAEGLVQGFARIVGKDGKPIGSEGDGPPTFGSVISDYSGALWRIQTGSLPRGPGEVALDEESAKEGGYATGDTVRITAAGGSRDFKMVGIATYGDVRSPGGATFALFDLDTASEFVAKPGYVDAVLVQGDGTLNDEQLSAQIRSSLSSTPDVEVLTGAQITEETQSEIGKALSFFAILLSVFSFIALGVGSFVIYNVFSISAAQRQRENALFRALGASRKQVVRSALVEAFAVGVFGSTVGLFTGLLLSKALGAMLQALGVDLPNKGLVLEPRTVVVTLTVGMFVTLVSAYLPARRSGTVPPIAAIRDTALDTTGPRRSRLLSGLASVVVGVGLVGAVVVGADTKILGLGILFVFAGTLILGPLTSRPLALALGSPLARTRGVTGRMAQQNAARNPKRTSRTAAPVLIGVALVTAVTALAASIKTEITDVFGRQFTGDYAISTEARGFGGLSPDLVVQVSKLPEVSNATGIGITLGQIDGEGYRLTVLDPKTANGLLDLGVTTGSLAGLTADGILVSDSWALKHAAQLGSVIDITLTDGVMHRLTVQGTYARKELAGRFTVSSELLANAAIPRFDLAVYVERAPNASEQDTRAAIDEVVKKYGNGSLYSKSEYIEKQASSVNQLLGLIYGLLSLSIVIAVVGIVITLLLSVFERRREIGLLRAVGMTKSQVRSTVRWESVITSLIGAVVGVVLGVGLGYVVILALRDQGLSTFSVPYGSVLTILVLSFFVGVVASVYPARRATKLDILEALSTT